MSWSRKTDRAFRPFCTSEWCWTKNTNAIHVELPTGLFLRKLSSERLIILERSSGLPQTTFQHETGELLARSSLGFRSECENAQDAPRTVGPPSAISRRPVA